MIVTSTESESNAKLVLSAIKAMFDEHNISAVDEFFSENFVQHSPFAPPGGKQELKELLQRTIEAMPDVHGTVKHVIAARDSVVVFQTFKGTIKKDMPDLGITASNQEFQVADLFQVADGKIVGHWEIRDTSPATKLSIQSM